MHGWPVIAQALSVIWGTRLTERCDRLGFGSDLRRHLSEDMTPELALGIYDDLVISAHTHEPEYRLTSLQFVRVERTGLLGLRHGGAYYPEGRFGNYDLVEPGQRIDIVPVVSGRLSVAQGLAA